MDDGTVPAPSSFKEHPLKRSAEDFPCPEDTKRPKLASPESDSQSHKQARSDPEEEKEGKRDSPRDQKLQKGKNKSEKNKGRRRGSRPDKGLSQDDPTRQKTPRLPKKQCALLIGFCGTGCAGMQIQPNVRTIEGVLFEALVKAGAVSEDNSDDPVKVNLARAARTDAGVHAAGNLVSMKIITSIPDLVSRVNEELPPEICLWSIVRAQNSFNARTQCDSRKYTYFFPTYLLIPPKPGSGLAQNLRQYSSDLTSVPFWNPDSAQATLQEDLKRKREWRVNSLQVEQLRAAAKRFEGTHNFHNFTVGRDFKDRSNQRHMKSIEVSDPAIHGETEWISVLFHGQSFMLHQIRKMMTILVLSVKTGSPPQIIDELYGPRMVIIPKMPSLGLLLEYPIFEGYNRKIAIANEKLQSTDLEYRFPIDFAVHQTEMEEFKEQHIYSMMRAIEEKDALFDAWMHTMDSYVGNDLGYMNPKGSIPATAVIKKHERRTNPFREKKRFDSTNFPTNASLSAAGDLETRLDEDEEDEPELDKNTLADMEG